jgi:flagellar biosynthesis/type III secretory pathway ATPase
MEVRMPHEPVVTALLECLMAEDYVDHRTEVLNVVDGLLRINVAIRDLTLAIREHTAATCPPPALPRPEPWINSGSTTNHQKE